MLFMAACVTPQTRLKDLRAKYPSWSQETLVKVSRGQVEIGMTKQEVLEALVSPPRYEVSTEGDRWHYVEDIIYGREFITKYGTILFFRDGRVVQIRHFQYIPDLLIYLEW